MAGVKRPVADLTASDEEDEGDYFPEPGQLSTCHEWYCCKNNDTVRLVAEKLGISNWADLADAHQNKSRYGSIVASSSLRRDTLLWVPKEKCSPWKLRQLERAQRDTSWQDDLEQCVECGKATSDGDQSRVILCDGCDSQHHLDCVGVASVPATDWFCARCLAILQQRKAKKGERPTLIPLPSYTGASLAAQSRDKLLQLLSHRREEMHHADSLPIGNKGSPFISNEGQEQSRQLRLMGVVKLLEDKDVEVVNMLREPDELILAIPVVKGEVVANDMDPKLGVTYAIYAAPSLFEKERDDKLTWKGVREAQRRLFRLLVASEQNSAMMIRKASVPSTVRIRSDSSPRCFDLSELVKDCDVDLDLPSAPTPSVLASNGLHLRNYQQSSLLWLIQKEQEESELGIAGELWHRLRFMDDSQEEYFFCELTGSFARSISEYRQDVQQPTASSDRFSLPTGGMLATAMGMGKTVIILSLIVANPPPPHRRILPREHLWALEKKRGSDHPEYEPPPSGTSKQLISNGTLIVVPMTLLSQWQGEIEQFASHLSVVVLHNEEPPRVQDLASADIVLVSTFILQQAKSTSKKLSKRLLNLVKRIHWHRVCVDEAHLNNSGQVTRAALSALSATHRHCVTGTPIGEHLADLYGNLRFLRVAPFDRPSFWKNLIEDPYYARDSDALQVLRSLLSRIVIRHSKSQTLANGQALLSLPPRNIENVLLTFGEDDEKDVYAALESRCRKRFLELEQISKAMVASNYIELAGMLTCVRQACSHSSLVSLEKLNRFNELLENRDKAKHRKSKNRTSNTRQEKFLKDALQRARPSARIHMRVLINNSIAELKSSWNAVYAMKLKVKKR